jgi:hypothetical protein
MGFVYDSVKGHMVETGGDGPFAGIGGPTGTYDYNKANPGVKEQLALQAATKAQGSGEGLSGISAHFGGEGTFIDQLKKMLQSGKYNEMLGIGKPPQPAGFGFDLPTLGAVGDIFGGAGKFMTGMGSLRVADTARDSYEEKKKYNALNWGQQLAKRAGEVSGENAMRMDDNSYRTAQGIGHLAEMIPA